MEQVSHIGKFTPTIYDNKDDIWTKKMVDVKKLTLFFAHHKFHSPISLMDLGGGWCMDKFIDEEGCCKETLGS